MATADRNSASTTPRHSPSVSLTVSPVPESISVSSTSSSKSKWKKLFSALRKSKSSGGDGVFSLGSSQQAFKLKHSHNCANAFLRAGISNMKGYKKANQDRCTAFSYLDGDPDLSFFGVYDGHGGAGVSNYLKDNLHQFIIEQTDYREGNMEEAILKAFLQADQELRTYGQATELTGSTATVVMIKHEQLFVANLGDSRAIACVLGLTKPLTCDHNTSNVKERERVHAMGGNIKDNRVGGVLIPTRSFGDFLLKSEIDKPAWKQVISAVPQIQSFKITNSWEFVVVGTDGVWDAMSNHEMISFIKSRLKEHAEASRAMIHQHRDDLDHPPPDLILSDLCEEILDLCCAKTVERFGKNCCDNMTIIIICFNHDENHQVEARHRSKKFERQRTYDKSSETGSSSVVSR